MHAVLVLVHANGERFHAHALDVVLLNDAVKEPDVDLHSQLELDFLILDHNFRVEQPEAASSRQGPEALLAPVAGDDHDTGRQASQSQA